MKTKNSFDFGLIKYAYAISTVTLCGRWRGQKTFFVVLWSHFKSMHSGFLVSVICNMSHSHKVLGKYKMLNIGCPCAVSPPFALSALISTNKDIFVLCSPLGTRTWSLELRPWEPRASASPSPHWRRCSLVRCVSVARSLPSTTPCLDAATKDALRWSTWMNIVVEKGFPTLSHLFLLHWALGVWGNMGMDVAGLWL